MEACEEEAMKKEVQEKGAQDRKACKAKIYKREAQEELVQETKVGDE